MARTPTFGPQIELWTRTRAIAIAIDGPVAVGKTTVGRCVASRLGYRWLDTGSMYRAVTWLALERGVDLADAPALERLAAETTIDVLGADEGRNRILVDGKDVSAFLRDPAVERGVSLVASGPGVRSTLVAHQRRLAADGGVVMVGRDIGTVVLPDAQLKVFLEATAEERARRRHAELTGVGDTTSFEAVLADMRRRDGIDRGRAASPLRPAPDAIVIETDGLAASAVVDRIIELVSDEAVGLRGAAPTPNWGTD